MTSSVLTRYIACSSDEASNPNLIDTHKTYRSKWLAKRAARKMNTDVFKVRIQYKNWLVRYITRFFYKSIHTKSSLTLGATGLLAALVLAVLLHQGKIDEIHAVTFPVIIFVFYAYDIITDAWLYMSSRSDTFEPLFSTLVASQQTLSEQTSAFFDYWEASSEMTSSNHLAAV